jgi:hypothetical protein
MWKSLSLCLTFILICTCGAWAQRATPQQDAFVAELAKQLESAYPGIYDTTSPQMYDSIPWGNLMCALQEMQYTPREVQAYVQGVLDTNTVDETSEVQQYLNIIYQTTKTHCPGGIPNG